MSGSKVCHSGSPRVIKSYFWTKISLYFFIFLIKLGCFTLKICFWKHQKASPNSSLIDFIKTGSMNLGAVDAQDLARQPIEPGNCYRFKHGSIGGRPVSPNFLAGTNLTKRCTFERFDKFNSEEHTLQHSLQLKWWVP